MRKLVMNPAGWPCTLEECPPGHFTFQHAKGVGLGFKSDYRTPAGEVEAFNEGGEFFCPGEPRAKVIVQPVAAEWVEEEV